MIVKTYGLYDGVAKNVIKTFVSQNDETAERACNYIVREPQFDKIAGKDYIVLHLYDMDTSNGKIVEGSNDCKTICALANAMAAYETEVLERKYLEMEAASNGKRTNNQAGNKGRKA